MQRPPDNSLRQFWQVATGKGALSCDHFVEDHAQSVNIASIVQRVSPYLFGRSVVNTANQRFRDGNLLVTGRACQAEVHHLNLPPAVQHQVFGLDIAVNNVTLLVGKIEGVSNLGSILSGQVLWHDSIDLQQAADRRPLYKLHHKIKNAALLPRVKDLNDIWMI